MQHSRIAGDQDRCLNLPFSLLARQTEGALKTVSFGWNLLCAFFAASLG